MEGGGPGAPGYAYVAERHPNSSVVGSMSALAACDVIFVATPVAAIADQVINLLAIDGSSAVIVDTGSAKAAIVADVAKAHQRALAAGARELDPPGARDWGDTVAYSLDPDGHVLAFAQPN